VDGAGQDLLAGAALPEDEDRGVGARGGLGELEDRLHRRALRDEIAEPVLALERLAQDRVLPQQALLRDDLLHHQRELLGIEGLHQVVVGPLLHGGHRGVDGGVGGHDHEGDVGLDLLRLVEDLEPVHPGHLEIRDDDGPALGLQPLHRARAVGRQHHRVAVLLQPAAQRLADDLLVVHHQDPRPLVGRHR
jgi:hypothetical protein